MSLHSNMLHKKNLAPATAKAKAEAAEAEKKAMKEAMKAEILAELKAEGLLATAANPEINKHYEHRQKRHRSEQRNSHIANRKK